jgi:ATP-binding cassette subfamily F protein 3
LFSICYCCIEVKKEYFIIVLTAFCSDSVHLHPVFFRMISISNLSIHFSGDYIFKDVSFIVNDKDRIGLVGKNGAGKTTLLRILCGLQEAESGAIAYTTDSKTGYLPQEKKLDSSRTVFEEALTAFTEARELEEKIKKTTAEIAHRTDFESEAYYKLINRLTEFNERFQIIGGHTMQADTEKVLTGLGFTVEDFDRTLPTFSGGWQMRVELAKLLLQKPDVLLLDEPTNHLDIESIQWLEDYLINYNGAVVIVSHDRAFLDNVTIRTIEISLAKIYDYKACYSEYVLMREERREQEISAYNNQQRHIASTELFIERFRYKSTKARQVQSRVKMLEKLEKIEVEDIDDSSIHFRFPPAPPSGKVIIETTGLGKSYGNKLVLQSLNFAVIKGDRLAFVGRNGEGKSTLSKIIVGELDHDGIIKLGHNVKIGYYAQNQADLLNGEKTVFQTIDDVATGDNRTRVRTILGCFLFSGDTIDKKVKVLSGGEKSRLALAKMLLTPVNLLILDEPTNHLDMRSKDILKRALLQYDGTLILVSHDRDFLQGLSNKVYEFKNHTIREYLGDIYDFLESRKLQTLKELEKKNQINKMAGKTDAPSINKINREKKKQFDKELRKISGQVEKYENEIHSLETELKKMDEVLINPETYKEAIASKDFYTNYESKKKELENKLSQWEKLQTELENIKNSEPN